MQNVNFKGTFLKPVNIKKLSSNGNYKTIKANFVELDHDDIAVINKIFGEWGKSKNCIIFHISSFGLLPPDLMKTQMDRFSYLTKNMNKEDVLPFLSSQILGKHLYAITNQIDNFKNLNDTDVLGVVEFYAGSNKNEIVQLQVRPDCISEKYGNAVFLYFKNKICNLFKINNQKNKRPYSNIGEAILTTLQKMYNNKPMELIPLNSAKGFYRRYDFGKNLSTDIEYTWKPKEQQ